MPKKLAKPSAPPKQTPCARCPLKTLPIFREFQANEIEFVEWFKTGEFVTDAGATIMMEGHSSPHLYTVLRGWTANPESGLYVECSEVQCRACGQRAVCSDNAWSGGSFDRI